MLFKIDLHPMAVLGWLGKAGKGGHVVTRFGVSEFEDNAEPGWKGDEVSY